MKHHSLEGLMEERRKVKHAIRRRFPVIDVDDSLEKAIQLMAHTNVSVLAVKVDEEMIGIVTVTDVMHGLSKGYNLKETKVLTFMTKCEFTTEHSTKNSCYQLDEDEDVLTAIKVMYEARVNHLLVTGVKHEPKGIVSSLELVKLVAEAL
jgi:predicted transcriptional regulator